MTGKGNRGCDGFAACGGVGDQAPGMLVDGERSIVENRLGFGLNEILEFVEGARVVEFWFDLGSGKFVRNMNDDASSRGSNLLGKPDDLLGARVLFVCLFVTELRRDSNMSAIIAG